MSYIGSVLVVGLDRDYRRKPDDIGQADAWVLMLINESRREVCLLCIPRDSMVDLAGIPGIGSYRGSETQQAALTYPLADGGAAGLSACAAACERICGIHPTKVIALDLSAVAKITEITDGIWVKPLEEVPGVYSAAAFSMVYGSRPVDDPPDVCLRGESAVNYLRYRRMDNDNAAFERSKRHLQFAMSLAGKGLSLARVDCWLPLRAWHALKGSWQTDMNLLDWLTLWRFLRTATCREVGCAMLPGHVHRVGRYVEYVVDCHQTDNVVAGMLDPSPRPVSVPLILD